MAEDDLKKGEAEREGVPAADSWGELRGRMGTDSAAAAEVDESQSQSGETSVLPQRAGEEEPASPRLPSRSRLGLLTVGMAGGIALLVAATLFAMSGGGQPPAQRADPPTGHSARRAGVGPRAPVPARFGRSRGRRWTGSGGAGRRADAEPPRRPALAATKSESRSSGAPAELQAAPAIGDGQGAAPAPQPAPVPEYREPPVATDPPESGGGLLDGSRSSAEFGL